MSSRPLRSAWLNDDTAPRTPVDVQLGIAVGDQPLRLGRHAPGGARPSAYTSLPSRSTSATDVVGTLDVEQREVRPVLGHEDSRDASVPCRMRRTGSASVVHRRAPAPGAAATASTGRARRTGSPSSGSTSRTAPWRPRRRRRCRRSACARSRSTRTASPPRRAAAACARGPARCGSARPSAPSRPLA